MLLATGSEMWMYFWRSSTRTRCRTPLIRALRRRNAPPRKTCRRCAGRPAKQRRGAASICSHSQSARRVAMTRRRAICVLATTAVWPPVNGVCQKGGATAGGAPRPTVCSTMASSTGHAAAMAVIILVSGRRSVVLAVVAFAGGGMEALDLSVQFLGE